MEIYYKSDFKIVEHCESVDLTTPFKFDYKSSSTSHSYSATFDGVEYNNCRRLDDGSLLVAFDNHGFGVGQLSVGRHYYLTDSDYADGVCDLYSQQILDVLLSTNCDCIDDTEVEVDVYPNYQKGDKGDKGADGQDGADGHTPEKGVDYYTEQEQAAIVEELLDGMVAISEAPQDGKKYVRRNGEWIVADAKIDLFIDLWNEACGNFGTYNSTTGMFELGSIVDIDYDEALSIYSKRETSLKQYLYFNKALRVNLPVPIIIFGAAIALSDMFSRCSTLVEAIPAYEICQLGGSNYNFIFFNCVKLRKVHNEVWLYITPSSTLFQRCAKLQYLELKIVSLSGVNPSISIKDSPLLTRESIMFTINNSVGNWTFVLHSDAYNRLTDDDLETAAAKNITLAVE